MKLISKYNLIHLNKFGIDVGKYRLEFIPGFRPNEVIVKADNLETGLLMFYYVELSDLEFNTLRTQNGKDTMIERIIDMVENEEKTILLNADISAYAAAKVVDQTQVNQWWCFKKDSVNYFDPIKNHVYFGSRTERKGVRPAILVAVP